MRVSSILLFLFCVNIFSLPAQEFLTGIENFELQQYSKKYQKQYDLKSKSKSDTILQIPFFDDFANSKIYPNSNFWEDRFAFISNAYAKNPVTINVATFDALDETGRIYSHLPYDNHDVADYLTSRPINLDLTPEDSVYLSFFYQAGGLGNTPEYRDSLVLQFRTDDTDWQSIWRVAGGENMDFFKSVMIPISDSVWFSPQFQFRFKNYVSLTSLYEPSWASNVDHWNIDFVYLDKNRTHNDSIPDDIAFIDNITSLIRGYEAIPWSHYSSIEDANEIIKDTIVFQYKNYINEVLSVDRRFQVRDIISDQILVPSSDDVENIDPQEKIIYDKTFGYVFEQNTEDSAGFEIKLYMDPGTDQSKKYRYNDTIRYYQNFFNYYAYDDGTAEHGYGIAGQGTANASLALRFDVLKPDSLQGVYMFFNHTLNEANQNFFYLTVWADNDGVPGDTIYQEMGVLPEYSDELNGFVYYPLETAKFIENTFYIGWVKTSDHILNIGFDVNRVSNQHLFYNVTGEWQQSSLEGAVMIRPVFGDKDPYKVSSVEPVSVLSNDISFSVFPNPASDVVYFDVYNANYKPQFVEIYSINGKLINRLNYKDEISITNLDNGLYFIHLVCDKNIYKPQRLLINR